MFVTVASSNRILGGDKAGRRGKEKRKKRKKKGKKRKRGKKKEKDHHSRAPGFRSKIATIAVK
jgi:hypothetical protein